jgi:hypothetical protein
MAAVAKSRLHCDKTYVVLLDGNGRADIKVRSIMTRIELHSCPAPIMLLC